MNDKEQKHPEIWALVDNITGHNAQVLGVAEAFNIPFTKKKIVHNEKASLPNFLKLNGFSGVDIRNSDVITAPWPDIVISSGRKSAPIAREIKKRARKSGKKCFTTHILWPGIPISKLNIIATPSHDHIFWPLSKSKRLFRFLGAPNRITKEFLLNEYRIWARTIGELPSPKITVLIGGDSKKTAFTEAHAKTLTQNIVELASKTKASVLVTTSRRTRPEVAAYMEQELKRRIGRYIHFHDFAKTKANPFYAFLQLADMVIVTGDSISMCSEACSTGKPVYIYSPEGNASEKHRLFHKAIIESGYAYYFDDEIKRQISVNGIPENNKIDKPLNSALDIANEIKKKSKLFY